jgi:hypothetical protein
MRAPSSLDTPRTQTMDIGYDHRLNKLWSIHVGGIDRRGSHELIVQALQTGAATGEMLLLSTGNSSYRAADVGINFTCDTTTDVHVSYARSSAVGDLNTLTNYMNAIMWPVVGANQYTTASTDVPNRFLARGRLMPTPRWLMLGIFDWRSGLPYSVVNDTLDYVGARNRLRFPTYARLEVGLERRFKILTFQPWIGVRVWNALSSFLPTEVQNNLGSRITGASTTPSTGSSAFKCDSSVRHQGRDFLKSFTGFRTQSREDRPRQCGSATPTLLMADSDIPADVAA